MKERTRARDSERNGERNRKSILLSVSFSTLKSARSQRQSCHINAPKYTNALKH